ncbi:MAG: class I SAM-dependent methyltransferase [Spirochaetaceae bacterium]|nr:MAG: class I SAM-dependent methyltransferase [Spirochaetaceae bacterium]
MIAVLVLILVVAVAGLTMIVIQTLTLGIPPMPSTRSMRAAIRDAVEGAMREMVCGDGPAAAPRIVELGCGWGGLARMLARTFGDSRVHAVERSVAPYLWCTAVRALFPLPNLVIERTDLLTIRIESPSVVVAYLSPAHMSALGERLPHTGDIVLVSCAFALPGHTPSRVIALHDLYRTPVYVYTFGWGARS